jgi:hypothetical protein
VDNEQKQLVLRYAQLAFKAKLGKNGDIEREQLEIRQKLSMTHNQILQCAEESLMDKFD